MAVKKNEMFVMAYRLEIYGQGNKGCLENFIEAANEYAIVVSETLDTAIIVATTEMLQADTLRNMALRFFGNEGYSISTLGLLGPFKK